MRAPTGESRIFDYNKDNAEVTIEYRKLDTSGNKLREMDRERRKKSSTRSGASQRSAVLRGRRTGAGILLPARTHPNRGQGETAPQTGILI